MSPASAAPPPPAPPATRLPEKLRRNLKAKRLRIPDEHHLDLHRLTLAEAQAELDLFLGEMSRQGTRLVLVITGKGADEKGRPQGAIRAALPLWLERPELARLVLAWSAAFPQDGGDGAFYLQLRARRADGTRQKSA